MLLFLNQFAHLLEIEKRCEESRQSKEKSSNPISESSHSTQENLSHAGRRLQVI
jgi:hypothetical protein